MKVRFFLTIAIFGLCLVLPTHSLCAEPAQWAVEERRSQQLSIDHRLDEAVLHAKRALDLAHADSQVSAMARDQLLSNLAHMYYLKSDYPRALPLAMEIAQLREQGDDPRALAVSYEDIAWILSLQGRLSEAEGWHQKATKGLSILPRAGEANSIFGDQPIIEDIWEGFTPQHHEHPAYGRYTYVIITHDVHRSKPFFKALLEGSINSARSTNLKRVNTFEIPLHTVKSLAESSSDTEVNNIITNYDTTMGLQLYQRICAANEQSCQHIGPGPYLVTFTEAIEPYQHKSLPGPSIYFLDLSPFSEREYPYIIQSMKLLAHEQSGPERLAEMRLQLLHILESFGPVMSNVGQVLSTYAPFFPKK